jgi:AAA family ATP:ADP antiporter
MPGTQPLSTPSAKSPLDRALSVFADVRAGEGATAVLMLVNIFILLVCYSVIKTVREPLILLGGGAEVRSYAAAGQALLLMAFVPAYGWFASRVDRARLLVGMTLFFIACVELFSAAVAARVPYVGVAFFIWVGIFNMSLVAQFWSFANDIYTKDAGDRVFPIIVVGMTAGAPLGSLIAARLFHRGVHPQAILQISALLLATSAALYRWINLRVDRRAPAARPMSASGGFQLVLRNPYLRLVAVLIVLLNVVNTTGEYMISRLLSAHVQQLAAADPAFDRQAFIGAFAGDYQFWVNVTAFLLQAFVASRLVKYRGLAGVLLALPLIALGGYAIVAAGAGMGLVRWIKTAENATDYSIMNTARQLLWLPTTRDEKYKAKQAIDTFFVRSGDVLSAAMVYAGASVLHLTVSQFARVNVVLTFAWLGIALLIARPRVTLPALQTRRVAAVGAAVVIALAASTQASAQESREDELAAARAEKATRLHEYEPTATERRILMAENLFSAERPVYAFIGSIMSGGALAVGPGYRGRFGDSGRFDTHAAWSIRNYRTVDGSVHLPDMFGNRLAIDAGGNWIDAPAVTFYGIGNDTDGAHHDFAYRSAEASASARLQAARFVALGAGADMLAIEATGVSPTYRRSRLFAEFDWRSSPSYTRRGGRYRIDWSDYDDISSGSHASFRRIDAEADQFVPILRENWVIAMRAAASTTQTTGGNEVPYYLLPDLGGSHTLRGYPTWRFRDRNRLALTGEFRWTAGPFVDMALFADAGKVAPRLEDLDLHDLKHSYGIGMTIHTFDRTLTRIELARTHDGMGVSLSFGAAF